MTEKEKTELSFFDKLDALNLSEKQTYELLFSQLYDEVTNTENPPKEPVPVLEAMLKKAKLIQYLRQEGFSFKNLNTEFSIHYSEENDYVDILEEHIKYLEDKERK